MIPRMIVINIAKYL